MLPWHRFFQEAAHWGDPRHLLLDPICAHLRALCLAGDAVPVYEGFALPHAITRSDVAGREVTDYFQLLLRRAGYPFHTTAEREVVREMKEIKCYVAKKLLVEKESRARTTQKYRLPDNNEIELGTEIFEAPEVRRPCRCRVALSIASFVSSCSAGFRCR